MVKLNSIVRFLNKELKVRKIKDPYYINGLQVKANKEVNNVCVAVDACMETFKKAKKKKCDLLIVHHGLLKPKQKDIGGIIKKKINFLKRSKISLYVSHLPLDKSKKYGNNTGIFKMLDAKPEKLFGSVGYTGTLKKTRSINLIKKDIEKKLKTKCKVWILGKRKIKKIAILSGYGGGNIPEAIKNRVDVFITGEVSHGSYLQAKDGKQSVIIAGHYKTETVGVKKLGKLLKEKFGLRTVFIDNPTGM